MRLVKSVRIAGFRSILEESLPDCGEHFVFVGRNSCGKSNALRALNVFFNGETSPGDPLDFERDVYFRPLRKQKKRIAISVGFELPSNFNFRKELRELEDLGREFSVTKSWELDSLRRVQESAKIVRFDGSELANETLVRDFLALIRFRYIPNRTIPAELLKDESQVIAGAIFKKMKESSKADDVLRGMSDSAGKLLNATSEAFKVAGAPLQEPNIMTSATLGEMLRMAGFQAKGLNGASVRDEDWGSGHQAFFLMNLLREIDTDYSRQFGWRQACIWAVEEPESGLHHDLQTRIARQFYEWVGDGARRLQIFTTTHSPVIAMSADSGCLVELADTTSVLTAMPVPELVRQAEDRGVTTYLHPALAFPFNPVVIVEGETDELVLNHVARIYGRANLRFVTLPRIESGEPTGLDAFAPYLKNNQKLLSKRQKDAPLIILLDWEASNEQLKKIRLAYGDGSEDYVVRCNRTFVNPLLGESFRGLERYYPEVVIKSAHEAGELVVGFPKDPGCPWSVAAGELSRAKSRLAKRVTTLVRPEALSNLYGVLQQVVEASSAYAERQRRMLL
ncbi:hypothetical protein GCM10011521_09660 [Arenimonas soli]|uniref:ATPase AAA-type core domain-containing protein n=1 Tax=Arenimonas soli TaxID=2269504 RepID=A0ABQ1HEB6_9GAMM|nr:AAA family ATPase [Arenimonas soli]GGA73614.1 hypothetical protein GCM10011521_09660 [Arenimonas soli]